jgi:hypothetical protein
MVQGGVSQAWTHHQMRPVHPIRVTRERGMSVTLGS